MIQNNVWFLLLLQILVPKTLKFYLPLYLDSSFPACDGGGSVLPLNFVSLASLPIWHRTELDHQIQWRSCSPLPGVLTDHTRSSVWHLCSPVPARGVRVPQMSVLAQSAHLFLEGQTLAPALDININDPACSLIFTWYSMHLQKSPHTMWCQGFLE